MTSSTLLDVPATASTSHPPIPHANNRVKRRHGRGYYAFLIPAAIGFVAIVFVPLAFNIYYSLLNWRGGYTTKKFVGLGNYQALLHDEQFWVSFRNTAYTIFGLVIVPTIAGIIIAAVLFDIIGRKFGGKAASFLRATFYLPQILPVAVVGVLWNWILGSPDGALNALLQAIGIQNPPNWLGDPSFAMNAVMMVLIWGQIGFPVVIFMAALQRVDPELYEAASLDGAGWWTRFRYITIPQIGPEVFVVALMAAIGALKVFGPIAVLTAGGPEGSTYVPSYYSYYNFFTLSQVGYGAAIANVLTVLIMIVAVFMIGWQVRRAKVGGN